MNKTQLIFWMYLLTSCIFGNCHFLDAHGDLHESIQLLTRQLNISPKNADLYFERGQLHHQHGDFNEAFADYQHTLTFQHEATLPKLAIATLLYDWELPYLAYIYIQQFLEMQPKHRQALELCANIHWRTGENRQAATIYTNLLNNYPNPLPEQFLNTAQTLLELHPNNCQPAIQILEKGQQQLGFLIVLQEKMINLAIHCENRRLALQKLAELLPKVNRKEKWLSQQADILLEDGQANKAKQSYKQALTAIQQLPKRHQKTPFTQLLHHHIEEQLNRIQ